ncbi:hypothetical protein GCM10022381_01430 [Leifsonia kafniensis]|uniref:Uncharacterized protein n=1 Tax=Leifsonia kafniensis TaxID=475957 RepID=A0ABP7JZY6_9MICO
MQLGQRDDGRVHRTPVKRTPLLIERGAHLVTDDDVRVQVGVAGTGVVMIKGRGDQPGDIDLGNGAVASS